MSGAGLVDVVHDPRSSAEPSSARAREAPPPFRDKRPASSCRAWTPRSCRPIRRVEVPATCGWMFAPRRCSGLANPACPFRISSGPCLSPLRGRVASRQVGGDRPLTNAGASVVAESSPPDPSPSRHDADRIEVRVATSTSRAVETSSSRCPLEGVDGLVRAREAGCSSQARRNVFSCSHRDDVDAIVVRSPRRAVAVSAPGTVHVVCPTPSQDDRDRSAVWLNLTTSGRPPGRSRRSPPMRVVAVVFSVGRPKKSTRLAEHDSHCRWRVHDGGVRPAVEFTSRARGRVRRPF